MVNQIISDMRGTVIAALGDGRCGGQFNGLARYFTFGLGTLLGNFFHLMAVTVTGGEIHADISPGWIRA